MAMTATDIPFEIRVIGSNVGALSHTQSGQGEQASYTDQEIYGLAPNNSYLKGLTNGSLVENSTYATDSTNNYIKWRSTQAYDGAEDKGLGPDSQGALTFSVVPKQSGELNPSFSLRIEGYIAPNQKNNYNGTYQVLNNSIVPITNESTDEQKKAVEHLNSHILFFKSRTNVRTQQNPKYEYSGLLDKEQISLADIVDPTVLINNRLIATANTPIDAMIYWIWPNTFGQMVFDRNSQTPVGADNATRTDIQNYILDNVLSVFDESAFEFEEGITESQKDSFNKKYDGNIKRYRRKYHLSLSSTPFNSSLTVLVTSPLAASFSVIVY